MCPAYEPLRKTERFKTFVRTRDLADDRRVRGWSDLCHPTTGDDFQCNYSPLPNGGFRAQAQSVDATRTLEGGRGAMVMKRAYYRIGFTAGQSEEFWERWKRGEGLKAIARVLGKPRPAITTAKIN